MWQVQEGRVVREVVSGGGLEGPQHLLSITQSLWVALSLGGRCWLFDNGNRRANSGH